MLDILDKIKELLCWHQWVNANWKWLVDKDYDEYYCIHCGKWKDFKKDNNEFR